jgi:cytochrome c
MHVKALIDRSARPTLLAMTLLIGLARAADVEKGHALFDRYCASCHTTIPGLKDKSGPNLHGLFGRRAGSAEYLHGYTAEVGNAGVQWEAPTLDLFLQRPARMIPGTKMVFRGIDSAVERADLICYLQHATSAGNREIDADCPPAADGS